MESKGLTVVSFPDVFLQKAISQLGIEEIPIGSNKGKDVEKYLKVVGLGGGHSWCMAFVQWCAMEAWKEVNKEAKKESKSPLPVSAGVLATWNKSPKEIKIKSNPRAGDIFIMDFGGGKGHTGIVTGVSGSRVKTIEGNASPLNGGREGYTVCRKDRPLSSMVGFIRIS